MLNVMKKQKKIENNKKAEDQRLKIIANAQRLYNKMFPPLPKKKVVAPNKKAAAPNKKAAPKKKPLTRKPLQKRKSIFLNSLSVPRLSPVVGLIR